MTEIARKPLRILLSAYACEPGKGSEPGVGWNWALALVRRGHQVWVLTRTNNRPVIDRALAGMAEPDVSRLHFLYYDLPRWAAWWKKGGRGVYVYYALWQRGVLRCAAMQHRGHRFDVVHHLTFCVWRQPSLLHRLDVPFVFGPAGGGEAAPWSLVAGMPSFAARANEYLRWCANQLALFNPQLRRCLGHASWVIATTPDTAKWIGKAGVTARVAPQIGVNPTGVVAVPAARTPAQPLKCLYAGRLIGFKGLHLGLRALAVAVEGGCDITFTIAGDGPMYTKLKNIAQQCGIDHLLRFSGWQSQQALFDLYPAHDLLVFPSLHDSGGNVVIEAFAHALPVLCLKLGGPGVLVDDTCGRVVDVTGLSEQAVVSRLADCLVEMARTPGLIETLRAGARTKAMAFTWDATVAQSYGVIEETLAQAGATSGQPVSGGVTASAHVGDKA